MDIHLNLINQSSDRNHSQIVIFQKNLATDFDEVAVAWKVIENLGMGDHHPFVYPLDLTVAAADSYGNSTPPVPAQNGQLFAVSSQPSGIALGPAGDATSGKEVQVLNNLRQGSISAAIYKDGRLLAVKSSVSPQQKAVFQFKPTLWIGVVAEMQEGQVMNSAILSTLNTELSLLGIRSADIVMTGGGPGPNSAPFTFTLNNIVMVAS